jgi:hypothetical protein
MRRIPADVRSPRRRIARTASPAQPVESLESRQMLAGNGLTAVYFNNANLTGSTATRTDATVNFNWKGASPAKGIVGDTFSARWTGKVQAKYSQNYTFSTVTDDGVRLWVNGKQIINQWGKHAAREDRGTIALQAGKSYDIKLEYWQSYGGSVAQLSWASASQRKEVVPKAQLYSGGATPVTPPASGGGTSNPVPTPAPAGKGALRVSSNGRYLVRADGSPFFYMADTAWQMPVDLTREEVDLYFRDRAAKGFNVVQIVAVDGTYSKANPYGQRPLHNNNPSTPNDAFFDHVDYIVNKAAQHGMYVAMVPSWGKNVANAATRIFNTTSAYDYGHFLGSRYRNNANIIWMNGADWPVNDNTSRAIWTSLARGLRDGDAGLHLMTFHAQGGKSSWSYWSPGTTWIDFSTVQSGHKRDSAAWDQISADYNKAVKPVIEGEPNYEDIPLGAIDGDASGPLLDAYDVRKKAYWEVFAGAAGTAYGANPVYQFATAADVARGRVRMDWKAALNLPGAGQMKHLKRLTESRSYLSRVPDQGLITSGTLSGTNHIQATRDVAGSYAFVYSASGKSFTVNMGKLTGGDVRAAWYDPRTGKVTPIGTYDNIGTRTFKPPTSGYGQDWVLTLDRA